MPPPDLSSRPAGAAVPARPAPVASALPTAAPSPRSPGAVTASKSSEGEAARAGMFSALALYPVYRRLWFGSQGASLAQWMQHVGLGWLALTLTNSESFVGLVAFTAGLPFLVVSVPVGALIDRVDRRRLMLACQGCAAVLAILVATDVILGWVEPWHLVAAAALNGTFQATLAPTQQSLVPSLVPREALTNAIGLNSAGQNMTRVVGPSLAGILIGVFGVGAAFVLQAAALVGAFALVLGIRVPPRTPSAGSRGVFDGVRLIARRPDLRGLFLLACIPTFFVFPYVSFLAVFARDILRIGPGGLGLLMAASGSGAVMGSLWVASRRTMVGAGRRLIAMTVAYGGIVIAIALSRTVVLSLPLLVCAGFFGASYMSANNALLQMRVDDHVRGRVISAYLLTQGLMPLGAMPMGLLADRAGAPMAVAAGAIVSSTLAAFLGIRSRELREL